MLFRSATRKVNDVLPAMMEARKNTAAVQTQGKRRQKETLMPKILDTSVIIDGRIADIMKTGFIEGQIVIPEFVLLELQHVSDSSDSLKRNRGRRGLDILNKLQDAYGIDIYNTTGEKSIEEIPEVDIKLLKLAQMINGKVVTNDYNLNKVAGVKGVKVLNINEVANKHGCVERSNFRCTLWRTCFEEFFHTSQACCDISSCLRHTT